MIACANILANVQLLAKTSLYNWKTAKSNSDNIRSKQTNFQTDDNIYGSPSKAE